jgi:hypothetical protein
MKTLERALTQAVTATNCRKVRFRQTAMLEESFYFNVKKIEVRKWLLGYHVVNRERKSEYMQASILVFLGKKK